MLSWHLENLTWSVYLTRAKLIYKDLACALINRSWNWFLNRGPSYPPCDLNTLRPRKTDHHFADDIFIFISQKYVPRGPINSISVSVQITAPHRTGDKLLSEPNRAQLTLIYAHPASLNQSNILFVGTCRHHRKPFWSCTIRNKVHVWTPVGYFHSCLHFETICVYLADVFLLVICREEILAMFFKATLITHKDFDTLIK